MQKNAEVEENVADTLQPVFDETGRIHGRCESNLPKMQKQERIECLWNWRLRKNSWQR